MSAHVWFKALNGVFVIMWANMLGVYLMVIMHTQMLFRVTNGIQNNVWVWRCVLFVFRAVYGHDYTLAGFSYSSDGRKNSTECQWSMGLENSRHISMPVMQAISHCMFTQNIFFFEGQKKIPQEKEAFICACSSNAPSLEATMEKKKLKKILQYRLHSSVWVIFTLFR